MKQSTVSGSARDRDPSGRPLNARARDALGRPLPRGSRGVTPIDERKVRSPVETLHEAQHLLNSGRPFQAHEVLELRWKRCPDSERDLWQALAQLAVGVTHALRGNAAGARSLLDRANTGLSDYEGPVPEGLGVAGVAQWLGTATAELDGAPTTVQEWLAGHPPPLT